MPELPEVEVIRRGLAPLIRGKEFDRPRIYFPGVVRHPSPEKLCRILPGRRVREPARKGKYLLLHLDRGILVFHLRMTGRLVYGSGGLPAGRHLHVELPFTGGSALYFSDMRKFGGLWLLENESEYPLAGLHRLGLDMLEEAGEAQFVSLLRERPRSRVKPLLLDQRFVCGLGNIYTDESLFRAGIHPCRAAGSLSAAEAGRLYRAIRAVLEDGIDCGGTTSRDYRDARGERGSFQDRLAVYGRAGEKCRCGATIARTVVAGRGTYLCPRCQVRGLK